MNKLFAIATGILALTSTVNAIESLKSQICQVGKQTWTISGTSYVSYEDAMSKVRFKEGYSILSIKYLRNGRQYIVNVTMREN